MADKEKDDVKEAAASEVPGLTAVEREALERGDNPKSLATTVPPEYWQTDADPED